MGMGRGMPPMGMGRGMHPMGMPRPMGMPPMGMHPMMGVPPMAVAPVKPKKTYPPVTKATGPEADKAQAAAAKALADVTPSLFERHAVWEKRLAKLQAHKDSAKAKAQAEARQKRNKRVNPWTQIKDPSKCAPCPATNRREEPFTTPASAQVKQEPPQLTEEEGVAAFKAALDAAGVSSSMEWPQAMKLVIVTPAWQSLRTLAQKRAVFEEYRETHKAVERERREAKLKVQKAAFDELLRSTPEITASSRWTATKELLAGKPAFENMADERGARRDVFDDYIHELSKAERAVRCCSVVVWLCGCVAVPVS